MDRITFVEIELNDGRKVFDVWSEGEFLGELRKDDGEYCFYSIEHKFTFGQLKQIVKKMEEER